MKTSNFACAAALALIGLAIAGSKTAFADVNDFEFQLAKPTVQVGNDQVFTVRLLNKKTGKPVPDAVIFATRLDMAPDAMEEMVTKVTPVPTGEPGSYGFKARFSMEGRWQLSLGAKVQGETGTVDNKLVITAQK
jgi:YtkA-like